MIHVLQTDMHRSVTAHDLMRQMVQEKNAEKYQDREFHQRGMTT